MAAEVVGALILVFAGTGVAVAALLGRPRPAPPATLWKGDRAGEALYRVIPDEVGSLTLEYPEGR